AEAMTAVPNVNPGFGFPGPERLLAADDDWLLEIDQVTGAATAIGPIGFPDVDGLGFDRSLPDPEFASSSLGMGIPDEFGLYGVTYSTNQLIRIHPFTGAGMLVADNVIPGRHLNAIAFRPTDGAAFVLTETQNEWRVYEIDKTTGAKIDRWILEGATSFESLLWSPDGSTLYSAGDRNGTKDLVTIELTAGDAGIATFVGAVSSGAEDIEALTWLHAPVDPADGTWQFRPAGATGVVPLQAALNDDLLRPAPNPFVNATRIAYAVPEGGRVSVRVNVYDVSGRRIRDLVDTQSTAGLFSATWDGRSDTGTRVAGGVYFFRVVVGSEAVTHRVVHLR
ncbi:T9SS type A sorting domain-containing protein, partial [bacterium]|nr:T9SS type A sorting domain-containing protein [bacterium]